MRDARVFGLTHEETINGMAKVSIQARYETARFGLGAPKTGAQKKGATQRSIRSLRREQPL